MWLSAKAEKDESLLKQVNSTKETTTRTWLLCYANMFKALVILTMFSSVLFTCHNTKLIIILLFCFCTA